MAGSRGASTKSTFATTAAISVAFVLLLTFQVEANRLNVPRVLLPVFNDFPVNFTLEVTEGGCYRWSTSRPDIIRLIPINEDYDQSCSIEVIVQTVTRDPTRKTAIVLAEDVESGHFLRCDVIVDAIHSLAMVTTTRELFIEEAPEAFEVRAYDEQGNEFTTLAGLEFNWEIGYIDKKGVSVTDNLPNNVLRFMTFQESPYETPHSVEMLDIIGKTGNIVLLEGVKTGTAKVSVKIQYPEYKHVSPVEVELIVVANLIIIPSDVTIMPFDSFTYRIVQVHQGRLEEIHIPTSQYYLEAENSQICEINNARASAYALMLGKTKVKLFDKNVHEEYGVILPTATVNVNEVAYITIAALPHRTRSLIMGHTHDLIVEMFDSKDHKFYIGENVEVTMKLSEKYFDKKFTTHNGTHVMTVPISTGTTVVEATLHGVVNKKGKRVPLNPELSARVEFTIHSAVTIEPRVLALPWDPTVKTRYDVALKASGGDGSYSWTSRQPSTVSVSQSGALKILQKGTADITVSLVRNVHNRDAAKVYVLEPTKLEIVQYLMEAAVGEVIYLHVALYGELHDGSEVRMIPFNDCRDLAFEVDIPDGTFVEIDAGEIEPVGTACTTVAIVSQTIGISKVSVTYGRNLTDNVTVSAYEPLLVVHPQKAETLLAVGSSRNIVFRGGPRAWSGLMQGYEREIHVSDKNVLEVIQQETHDEDVSIFRVLCKSLGEEYLTFNVHNIPTQSNSKGGEALASVKVTCGKPRYISLQPEFKEGLNCPVTDTDRIVARSEESLRMLVVVKDENDRKFDNITSLNIEWNVKPPGSALMETQLGSLEQTFVDYHVHLPKNHYQQVVPKKYTDSLTLKAKITGYQKSILSRFRITPEYPAFPIENDRGTLVTPVIESSVEIFLVNDTTIYPKRLKILNDPNSKYYLQVSQGSGYYELVLSNHDVADVRYVEPTRTISIVPRTSGMLHIALVDQCLASEPAEVEIEVQQLASLEVECINKVEIGTFVMAKLQMYDTNGALMMLPVLEALDIKVETENGYIQIERVDAKEYGGAPYDKILYLIHGLEEGEAQIVFSSGVGDKAIRSDVLVVQVFSPLQLLPKNLTTLVGTIYQLSTVGGPNNAEIEFSTDDESVLTIDGSGVIEGKATGHTTIYAKAVGEDARGKKVVFSQDKAEVRVILLEGVKIVVPTTRVKLGAVIPVWAFGIPDHLTPLVIGSMRSPLVFSWVTSDNNVMSLHEMYEGTGINVRYQNEVTLRARANKPGVVTLQLTASTPCNVLGGCRGIMPTFSASIKIEIFEELRLMNDDMNQPSLTLIMAPNSSMKIKTNRDKQGMMTYKVLTDIQSTSAEVEDSNALSSVSNIISVDRYGNLKSGDQYGHGIIQVTNVEAYSSKQTLTIAVYVKPIHYVMLSLKSNVRIRSGEELTMLPKGMDLDYILECYDSVGSKFNAAHVDFKTLSSRTDLVTFTQNAENTVNAKFLDNGEVIVKVFNDKYPNGIFDYVHMIIGDVLFPTKSTLTVGDVVCFSMPLLSADGDLGYWQSSAPEILHVDPVTGIGRARSPGVALVKHSIATSLRDEVEITVSPIAKVTLLPLKGKNITGIETFSVPLVLKGKHELIKENNVLSRGLGGCRTQASYTLSHYPIICTVQFTPLHSTVGIKDLFYAKPRFDIATGFYYCDIIPMGLPSVLSSTLETKLRINALSRDIEGTPIEVSYLPPMYIPTREIIFLSALGQDVPTANLDIYGLPHVLEHIIIETPEEVSVGARQYLSRNLAQYKLSLTQNQDEVQGRKIIITNELTKQNVSLLIRVPKYDQFPRISGIHWVDYMYFHRYTLGTLVILTISFFHYWKNTMTHVDVSVKNKNVYAEKCSPPLKKPGNASMNQSGSSSPGSPGSPFNKPFSAFEPVYGDPRGFFTPNTRRNRTCL